MSEIGTHLRANAAGDPALSDWVAGLPSVIISSAQRWSLDLGPPYQPGGVASWVAPGRTPAGERVVLKIGCRHWEARDEALGLRVWDGDGTVRLLDHEQLDERTEILLLEECVPGTPLRLQPEPDQDVVVAGLLRRLWIRPDAPVRPLAGMCARWADGLDLDRATAHVGDAALVQAGVQLFRELPQSGAEPVLLATDLHAGNVLAAQREPWLVIDPKPYLGDPAYDVLQHLLNCTERLVADPRGLARRLAGLLDLDAERVTQWLFARCVIESAGRPELAPAIRALAP